MRVRRSWIREMADGLLKESNIKAPPIPVSEIAKAHGILVKFVPFDGELSGFVYRKGDRAIIWVNSSHPKVRRRFSLAHELGHYFLHEGKSFHVDRPFQVRMRSNHSSRGDDPEEVEANLFAAELLMPARWLLRDLRQLSFADDESVFETLSEKYGVSSQALAIRLATLGHSIK